MATYTLTDVERDLWVESLAVDPSELGLPTRTTWSISKQTLRGGRRDGVDLIRVNNGALGFNVCPTRGMNLWSADYKGDRIGWRSPVVDGPINPKFVTLPSRGGLGWLQGFDELMARCGLENNGAPYQEGTVIYPLHGRISNIPAHRVLVHVEEEAPHTIAVEGQVDESELFFTQLRLSSRIETSLGSNRLTIRDTVSNLGDRMGEFELLYHWNFGPPHLDEGARFLAPVKEVAPRDARAAEGLDTYDVYGPPEPGFAEQVYFFKLYADGQGQTVVMLRNRAGDRGVALRFNVQELPCFTLWKSTQGLREGYVTGLEPGVNFPNPKPFEKAQGRVVTLAPNSRSVAGYQAETTLEILEGPNALATVEAEIQALQEQGVPTIHERPVEPFAPES